MSLLELLPQIPSPAFGDGTHPTTQLCAKAVEFIGNHHQPNAVLDVGTGTGILARIARARGATFIVGTDIDEMALMSAKANAALDSSSVPILFVNQAPNAWGPRFDLVIANILEGVLLELAPGLVQSLAPGGRLLLSGFTRPQVPALEVAFSNRSLELGLRSHLDDWALLLFRAP